ncbi:MAG: carboxypeptidase-like regulatory domain-containing protein [Acidobacteriota bacterium]|nr:carboxypeptidase-like regulatory domain-containing protein [Acidobacteriota bacterium]
MNAVPAALISVLLASGGVGFGQQAETAAQPPDQATFSTMRDLAGGVKSKRRIRFEGAVETMSGQGCYDPADIEWQGLVGMTAEGAAVYRLRSPSLMRIIDRDTGRSRYGLRLPSSRLGLVQDGDDSSRAMGRVTSGVTVVDGATEEPVRGARVLLLADQGRPEPLLCLLDTDSEGTAVLPQAQWVFGTVVAAEGFVGGVVTPDPSGPVRLARSRTISGRVQGAEPWAIYDAQGVELLGGYGLVAAIPHKEPDGENEDIVAAALVDPDGGFVLHGIPPSTSRLLLAMFRADDLIAMSLHASSGSPASVPVDDASVTFISADPDARVELRFLRLPDGSEVQDYALGRMARPQLRQEESSYSRRRLPSGWYDIRAYDRTLAEFFLEPDEELDLGVLGTTEEFTLEVRGLDGRPGDVWWSKELCFDNEVGSESTRTAVGPQQLATLRIPEGCKAIWGQVSAPGMIADHFDWSRGDPLAAVVTLRPGFPIRGTVWGPSGRPLENARVSAFDEFELSRSRDGRYPKPAATSIVDEVGRFELTVEHRSAFFVRAVHSGYFAPPHRVDLSSGPAPALAITARRGAAVTGVVRSPSGRPVEGATVHWCYLGREPVVSPSTYAAVHGCKKQRPAWRDRAELALWNLESGQMIRTDAAGAFRAERKNVRSAAFFTALPPGEIEFTVRPWAGRAESSIHTLKPGDNEIEITLRNGHRIEGQVLGLPEGSPAAEVHLTAGREPDVWTRWSTKTAEAEQGAFLFENLSSGSKPYHLYATAPGYKSLESHVVLQAGDDGRAVVLKLVPNSSEIEGAIYPLELGSEPRLTAISRTAEQRTVAIGTGGSFAFTNLPVGEWRLILNHGVPSGREEITVRRGIALVREDALEHIDIDLGSLPTIHFVGQQPGGMLRIHSDSELDYVFGPVASVPVGETGRATIHAPAPGTYRVSYVTRPGPNQGTLSFSLYRQWLEGTQTFHVEDFEPDDF